MIRQSLEGNPIKHVRQCAKDNGHANSTLQKKIFCLIDFLKKKKSIMFLWACLLICSPTEVMKKLCDQ